MRVDQSGQQGYVAKILWRRGRGVFPQGDDSTVVDRDDARPDRCRAFHDDGGDPPPSKNLHARIVMVKDAHDDGGVDGVKG